METQQCPYCREKIPAKSVVCPVCDTNLSIPPPGIGPQPHQPPPGPAYPTNMHQPQWQQQTSQPGYATYEPDVPVGIRVTLYVLSIILTSLVGIIAGTVYKSHTNPSNQKFGRTLFNWSIAFLVIRGICIIASILSDAFLYY